MKLSLKLTRVFALFVFVVVGSCPASRGVRAQNVAQTNPSNPTELPKAVPKPLQTEASTNPEEEVNIRMNVRVKPGNADAQVPKEVPNPEPTAQATEPKVAQPETLQKVPEVPKTVPETPAVVPQTPPPSPPPPTTTPKPEPTTSVPVTQTPPSGTSSTPPVKPTSEKSTSSEKTTDDVTDPIEARVAEKLQPQEKVPEKVPEKVAGKVPEASQPNPTPTEPKIIQEPIQKSVPVQEPVPIQKPTPVQEPIPTPKPILIQEPIPIKEPVPIQKPIPVQEPTPTPKPVPTPSPTTTPSPPPSSISLTQIHLDLLPPFTDPSISQFQFRLTLPLLFSGLELSATLQQLYQGEIANTGTYETIYQIAAFRTLPNLEMFSGTLTVTSTEPILLDSNLLKSSATWKKVQFQLNQQTTNFVIVGKVERDAPSSEQMLKYFSEISFQFGKVSGNYQLRLERSLNEENPCPWYSLDHKLVTKPAEVLYFDSYIDHICNDREDKEDDVMNIEINVKSAVFPLANFYLNQTFNFGTNGDEAMSANHPLVDFGITGFWNGDAIYSKTLKLNPTAIGSSVFPFFPSTLKAIFTRYQVADEASQSYTVHLEKSGSPSFSSGSPQQQPTDRLSLSSLVVKITGAFISATTVVLSANGALLSGILSQLEYLIEQALVAAQIESLIPFDVWYYQLTLELAVFVLLILLLSTLLQAVGLLDSVIRLALIVIFVEICVATVGVQCIALGFL